VACIVANVRVLKAFIVIPLKIIEVDLYECRFTPDTCHILFQEHGFLTRVVFAECAEAVVFPDTIRMRQSLDYAGPISLILDGFIGHLSDAVEE
jgi:hypothetical protein